MRRKEVMDYVRTFLYIFDIHILGRRIHLTVWPLDWRTKRRHLLSISWAFDGNSFWRNLYIL